MFDEPSLHFGHRYRYLCCQCVVIVVVVVAAAAAAATADAAATTAAAAAAAANTANNFQSTFRILLFIGRSRVFFLIYI